MRSRPYGTVAISEWEVNELLHHRRCGWTLKALASYYGLSTRTISRYVRRAERDSGPATRRVD